MWSKWTLHLPRIFKLDIFICFAILSFYCALSLPSSSKSTRSVITHPGDTTLSTYFMTHDLLRILRILRFLPMNTR